MAALVVSQPMFLPWRGLFEQIKLCDIFVFYDDVQLPKGGGKGRGFHTRVQIKTEKGWEWLSVPITRSGRGLQLIKDACFLDFRWKHRHLVKIQQAYQSAPFFQEIYDSLVLPIYKFETQFLNEFCTHSMKLLCDYLELHRQVYASSEIDILQNNDPNQRLVNMCLHFNAKEYITGHGAKNYLNYDLFEQGNIVIKYMQYRLTPYPQLYGEFNPYVTILDLLFNVGKESLVYLDSEAIYWREFIHG